MNKESRKTAQYLENRFFIQIFQNKETGRIMLYCPEMGWSDIDDGSGYDSFFVHRVNRRLWTLIGVL